MNIQLICYIYCTQLGVFSSQVLQDSSRDKMWRRKHCNLSFILVYFEGISPPFFSLCCTIDFLFFSLTAAPMHDMEKHCNIEIAAQISRLPSSKNGTCVLVAYEYFLFLYVFLYLNENVECFYVFLLLLFPFYKGVSAWYEEELDCSSAMMIFSSCIFVFLCRRLLVLLSSCTLSLFYPIKWLIL